MKRIIIIALLSCAFTSVKAQLNFVLNGSFEQHDTCPYEADEVKFAKYWDAIDTNYSLYGADSVYMATSDQYPEYLNVCGTGVSAVPLNGISNHYPRTGNAMVSSNIYFDYIYIARV